ncbi:MAG TPA: glycoside hydrolase family 3 N-terminal domain-containing protein [Actinoplanes sp.]|nr:glycoside hydrolase family 3 N-terminal domain-containing protein [Actinoplanes sp.]
MTVRPLWRVPAALVAVLLGACSATGDDGPPVAPSPAPPQPVPSSPPSPSPAATGRPACVAATVNRMTPQQRAGQVLMIGTPVDEPGRIGATVARRHLGGVFLAGRSTRSATSLRRDITAIQGQAEMPLLIALDQEGGSVQTLKGTDFPLLPSAQRLGAGPPAKLRATVRDSARRLAAIGVTVNLAPVADTVPADVGTDNPPIGAFRRQYGSDPGAVADDVAEVVAASQDAGVLTILKHFPGLGRVRANTDTSTRAVDRTATVDDPHLEPFAAGIKAGSGGVMVSSASYPKLDDHTIATFSKPIITGLLRDRLKYTGMVMSDDVGAADATESVPVGERAVRFVAAGGDLVLTIRPEDAAPMSAALLATATKDPAFAARLADAARHVVHAKYRAGLLTC